MNIVDELLKDLEFGTVKRAAPYHRRSFRKAYLARGMGMNRMQDFEFVHDTLGHPSLTTMESIQNMRVIEGMTTFQ